MRKWSVAALAKASAASRTVLVERFRAVIGQSPMRYLREWRLFQTCSVLAGTRKPISHTAEEAGYDTEASNAAGRRAQWCRGLRSRPRNGLRGDAGPVRRRLQGGASTPPTGT